MKSAVPYVQLSSQDLPPEIAFEKWKAVLPHYDIRLPDGYDIRNFRIEACAWLLDPIIVMAGYSTTAHISRVPKGNTKDEANLVFNFFSEGRWVGDADGSSFDFGDGELIGLDTARPYGGLSTDSHWIMVNVPRRALAKLIAVVPDLHGHVFRSASASFLIDHMVSLTRHLPTMQVAETARITRAALCLIAAALDELTPRERTNQLQEPSAIRLRVERYIQQNLSDFDLTPKSISDELGITRSTLYRAFEPFGGVATFITELRLEAARAILFHPEDHRSISEIANILGFPSTATFSKAFSRRFGCSPRTARSTGSTSIAISGQALFRLWENALRDAEPDNAAGSNILEARPDR